MDPLVFTCSPIPHTVLGARDVHELRVDFDWEADNQFTEANTLFRFEGDDPQVGLALRLPADVVITRSSLWAVCDRVEDEAAALAALYHCTLETFFGRGCSSRLPVAAGAAALFWDALGPSSALSTTNALQLPVRGYYARRHSRVVPSPESFDDLGVWVQGPSPLNMVYCVGGLCGQLLTLVWHREWPWPAGSRVYLRADAAYAFLPSVDQVAPHEHDTTLTRVPIQMAYEWSGSTESPARRFRVEVYVSKVNAVAIWTDDGDAVDNVAFELIRRNDKMTVPMKRHGDTSIFVLGEPGDCLVDHLVVRKRNVECQRYDWSWMLFDVAAPTARVNFAWLDVNFLGTQLLGPGLVVQGPLMFHLDEAVGPRGMQPHDGLLL